MVPLILVVVWASTIFEAIRRSAADGMTRSVAGSEAAEGALSAIEVSIERERAVATPAATAGSASAGT